MKITSKLLLYKIVEFLILVLAILLLPISKMVTLILICISFIFDFIYRRCPSCGYHIKINENIKHGERCKKCGNLFDSIDNKK